MNLEVVYIENFHLKSDSFSVRHICFDEPYVVLFSSSHIRKAPLSAIIISALTNATIRNSITNFSLICRRTSPNTKHHEYIIIERVWCCKFNFSILYVYLLISICSSLLHHASFILLCLLFSFIVHVRYCADLSSPFNGFIFVHLLIT